MTYFARARAPGPGRASSAKISGMARSVWVLIALLVLTVGPVTNSRGLERKGREMERHRD
jgi:hypothetical protein